MIEFKSVQLSTSLFKPVLNTHYGVLKIGTLSIVKPVWWCGNTTILGVQLFLAFRRRELTCKFHQLPLTALPRKVIPEYSKVQIGSTNHCSAHTLKNRFPAELIAKMERRATGHKN
ncbi:unnamed protein product [Ixodes pacificus]